MSPPRPRVALTGATGFLGRHVVAALADRADLVCVSRGGSAPDGHAGAAVDVSGPDAVQALAQAFAGCDAIVHAAGRVSHVQADAGALWQVHVRGTENVMAAARQAGVRRVVYISTSGTIAVSTGERPQDEDAPSVLQQISRWPYYRSKWVAEDAALAAQGPGLDVICLNPGLLLGPGDDADGASTQVVRLFLDDGMSVVPQGGPCVVDVRDVAAAVVSALTRGRPGQRYLLGGANLSWSHLFGALARITGRPGPALTLPSGLVRGLSTAFADRLRDDGGLSRLPMSPEELELASHYWYADWRRAQADLDFHPRDVTRTLEDTALDILERRRRGFQLYRSGA